MGSEMCIRDSGLGRAEASSAVQGHTNVQAYDTIHRSKKGFLGMFKKKQKPDNLDE